MGIFCKDIDGHAAFYDEAVHGPRQVPVAQSAREIKAGKRPRMVDNPDCTIPADAVPIDAREHQRLLAAQADGKQIVMRGGKPAAVDGKAGEEEHRAMRRRQRDRRLAASDWTQLPDSPLDAQVKAQWATYRQALRDLDLDGVAWPDAPGEAVN